MTTLSACSREDHLHTKNCIFYRESMDKEGEDGRTRCEEVQFRGNFKSYGNRQWRPTGEIELLSDFGHFNEK